MSFKKLARATAGTLTQFRGRRYIVPPPTVEQVTTIMAATEGGGAVRLGNDALIREAIREWWPYRMASAATAPKADLAQALEIVRRLVLTRTTEARKAIAEDRDTGDLDEIDWEAVVADYMAVYGVSRQEVSREKWPAFLQGAKHLHRQMAKMGLMYLRAKSIPYIEKEREREKAMDRLREEAGYETDLEEEDEPRTREQQLEALERLKRQQPARELRPDDNEDDA